MEDVMTGCHGGCHDGISWRMCLSYGFSKMVKKSCEFLPSIYARHDFYVGSSRFFLSWMIRVWLMTRSVTDGGHNVSYI